MPNPNSPLNDDHLAQIRNALDIIGLTEQQIEMAKRAGIDVSAQEAQLRDAKSKLLSIKQVYFPGQ